MSNGDRDWRGDVEFGRLASVDLNLLVPLLALLEEESVTRAAERVGMSQPAMSHALQRMRRLMGDELLVRQGTGMVLTPRAMELIAPLRGALRRTARLVSATAFDPATDNREITMAMTTSTVFVIGSAISRLLAERAPNMVLRLVTTTMRSPTMFTDDGVFVTLLSETFPSPYPRERLYEDRWVVVAPGRAPRDADAPALLETLPHVIFDASPAKLRPYTILDEERVKYSVREKVTDSLLIPHLVGNAGGVAVQRHRVASAFRDTLDLRVEEFPFPIQTLGIDMIWNPRFADEQFRVWLRALLAEAASTLPTA
ncbi:DNA-binding transcriptional LysR family regulator [Okibacterium sp. HSC-33S16]|uniref:LysR family transcriptional regulator n=1 Tax=Okibacterium sp. HSC-33S16 TaxID=2910965 RepID=UPI00209FB4DE|nr:LysR family transcriptional regulator [Okibacterium sp. HSC-33S16]MCP2031059.1 DNA-binding transcriptional LysR family regulator [Okibacterium sp. HSC-33S16]